MKISTKGRYAIIALVDMIYQKSAEDQGDSAITLSDISRRQNLPLVYLEQLFLKLKKATIVKSVRGRKGGYLIAGALKDISLRKILDAVDEKVEPLRCVDSAQKTCEKTQRPCQTHALWSSLENHIFSYLDRFTLEDIKENSFTIEPLGQLKNSAIYLDYNATCPMKPGVQKAMTKAFEIMGNASSMHSYGRQWRKMIEQAREKIAATFNVQAAQIIFTSGGTESNALALASAMKGLNIRHLYISAIEHDSVRASAQHLAQELSATLTLIPPTDQGVVTLEKVQNVLGNVQENFLVCLMAANNETGVIQPLKAISHYVHQKGGVIHCDAVQALGKMPLDFVDLDVDTPSCSAHKIGGPQGIGILIKKDSFPIYQLWQGGGQERGYRSGTENGASIIGFAEALKQETEDLNQWRHWQHDLEQTLQQWVPMMQVFGQKVTRLVNTSCFTMPGVDNQRQVIAFDLAGYAVSAGAACSSGKVKSSPVLEAMNIPPEEAKTALRLSWGWKTTKDELDHFAKTWYSIYQSQIKKNKDISL